MPLILPVYAKSKEDIQKGIEKQSHWKDNIYNSVCRAVFSMQFLKVGNSQTEQLGKTPRNQKEELQREETDSSTHFFLNPNMTGCNSSSHLAGCAQQKGQVYPW